MLEEAPLNKGFERKNLAVLVCDWLCSLDRFHGGGGYWFCFCPKQPQCILAEVFQ